MPSCNITLFQWCVYWLLGLSKDLREGLKINKGPLSGYIDSLHLWLPVGLQSIQFRPPYKVRIVRRFLTLWPWHYLTQCRFVVSWTNVREIKLKCKNFHSRKCISKCCLPNGSHFVWASLCWHIKVFKNMVTCARWCFQMYFHWVNIYL